MVGVLVSANYKYTDVQLASGAKVTATGVTIKDGKVIRVDNGNVTFGEDKGENVFGEQDNVFHFSVHNNGGKLVYNTDNVPADINGQNIAEEFVSYVEQDLNS